MSKTAVNCILFGSTCGMGYLAISRRVPDNFIGMKERDGSFYGEPLLPGKHFISPYANLHFVSTKSRHRYFTLENDLVVKYSYEPNIGYLETAYWSNVKTNEPDISNMLDQYIETVVKNAASKFGADETTRIKTEALDRLESMNQMLKRKNGVGWSDFAIEINHIL